MNICRPTLSSHDLLAPIHLDLPGSDLPLRLFRVKSQEEYRICASYRELMTDFSDVMPKVHRLMTTLPSAERYGSDEWAKAVEETYKVQQEMREWREKKLPLAGLVVGPVDPESPLSCHRQARSVLFHHAVGCVEGIITRHWLTMGKFGSALQQHLHDECLMNAQRAFNTIPTVRALLETRHAPFVSTFIVCGLFNAATCFAIPLLRAVNAMDKVVLPAWPEEVIPSAEQKINTLAVFNQADIKQYANNILIILDVLAAFNALPCGKLAQDRLEALIQQFGLRSVPQTHTETLWTGMEMMDPFPGLWDELLQMDPGVWEGLLGESGVVSRARRS